MKTLCKFQIGGQILGNWFFVHQISSEFINFYQKSHDPENKTDQMLIKFRSSWALFCVSSSINEAIASKKTYINRYNYPVIYLTSTI